MAIDKVASSPALPSVDGWTAEEPSLSENETAALTVALGVGISVSATTEEPRERHTFADLASLEPDDIPVLPPIDSVGVPPMVVASNSALRLQTLTEASSEGDSRDSGSEVDDSDKSPRKVASFYIGDEQGCTRDLPQATSLQQLPQGGQGGQGGRRVQILAQQTKLKTVEFTPPDGGYGWVVALAACLVNVWIVGFIKSYGVLYVHVRSAFPESSAYHTSWLPALLSTIGLLIAPLTGTLCRNFTSRKVTFAGGILCCLGLVLGSQAVSMNQLILSVGVLTGLGAGLTTTPGVLIVSLYFEKRRALASAICVSGNALGGFFMPPLIDYLLYQYSLRGTMLILAAMQLHICAASMLYRPIRLHALIQAEERLRRPKEEPSETQVPVPEHNKLLPNTPATTRANLPSPASAPGTPLNRPHAIWQRMVRNRLNSTTTVEEEELRGEVSFLRSASMMNSIPDLTLYARSWSISGERTSMGSRSSIRMALGSKSSLSRLSIAASSKSSLSKLVLTTENKHPPLVRLTSEGSETTQKVARHPTLVRLASEEEGGVPLSKNRSGSIRQSQSRLSMEGRPALGRQSSCRRVQGRIMTAVKEQDTDSQISEEMDEEQTPKRPEEDKVQSQLEKPQDEKEKEKDEDEEEEEEDEEEEEEESSTKSPNCFCTLMLSCIDVSLFKNPLFLLVAMSVFFMATGAPHAIFFLPAYAESVDIPSSQVPKMLSISSIVDLVGRLGIGFLSDLGLCKISYLYFVSGMASGLSVLLVPQVKTFATLTTVLSVYGFGIGAWFVLIPTLLAQHHGAARLASSYGLARLFHGCMNFISPQVNGILVDTTNSFVHCYYFMGFSMVISAFLLLLEPPLVKYTADKEKKKQEMEARNNNQV